MKSDEQQIKSLKIERDRAEARLIEIAEEKKALFDENKRLNTQLWQARRDAFSEAADLIASWPNARGIFGQPDSNPEQIMLKIAAYIRDVGFDGGKRP